MPTYFYVSGDNLADNPLNNYDIYRFRLNGAGTGINQSSVQLVNNIAGTSTTQDIEGLATRYNNSGVGVSIAGVTEGGTPNGFLYTGVDAGNPPVSNITIEGPSSTTQDLRVGNEAGADYYFNANNLSDNRNGRLYNIQGNDTATSGAIGYQLYTISNNGNATAVGSFNSEFADGLAINSRNGQIFASDFSTGDSDGNEIYRLNPNGSINTTYNVVGATNTVSLDSGLAFDATGNLYALTEDGTVYSITLSGSTATATSLGVVLPNYAGDLEGFAIIDEPNTPTSGRLASTTSEDDDELMGTEANDSLSGKTGNDLLEGLEGDDTLRGNVGDDSLYGGDGKDVLIGGRGSDILSGGLGNDVLIGDTWASGRGSDTFVLASGEGTDKVYNFQAEEDFIGLAGGLSFGSLSIFQDGENTKIGVGEEVLAIFNQVDASTLTESNFVII
jgi:hypothetical protein